MRTLRVAVAQINPTVGDLEGNANLIEAAFVEALRFSPDLVAFPELALTGYPLEDLVLRDDLAEQAESTLRRLAPRLKGAVAIVGTLDSDGPLRYNAAAAIAGGRIRAIYRKQELPNYGVFDEGRTFAPGTELVLLEIRGVRVALTVCEDLWEPDGPVARSAEAGAECVVTINASPFHRGKALERQVLAHQRSVDHGIAIVYSQMIGGQDELVFDGGSMIFDSEAHIVAKGSRFEPDIVCADLRFSAQPERAPEIEPIVISATPKRQPKRSALPEHHPLLARSPVEEVYEALLIGVRDYCNKNRFPGAIVGLSGGIDSALTATIAADALSPDRVLGIAMPSRFNSGQSLADAKELAANLGIDFEVTPIDQMLAAFEEMLEDPLGAPEGLWHENLQSRIRGTILMARSNDSGRIVLTTGNKSELAVGYATLYGDTAGGFAVLKDVPKTLVYELAAYRNTYGLIAIPEQVFTRPPTAELRPDQADTDSLPPYEELDPILETYVEKRMSRDRIVESGFDAATVDRVLALVDAAEYKRRQTPPGVKITPLSFGRDRRLPITNRFTREAER
ncbi:MAG: NAD+ synthase [Actinomycetota bacterium]